MNEIWTPQEGDSGVTGHGVVSGPEPSADGGDGGSRRTAVAAPPDDDPVGRILEDVKRLTVNELRRLAREIDRLLR